MKKNAPTSASPWDDAPTIDPVVLEPKETLKETPPNKPVKQALLAKDPSKSVAVEFDLEGLMTDFPTAKELERFVYDQTGMVLNLKGRANKLKYQVAMDCLNGETVDPAFIGGDNPYIEKTDLVPVEDMKAVPARDPGLPAYPEQLQNEFVSRFCPHPDPDFRALDRKVDVVFRK